MQQKQDYSNATHVDSTYTNWLAHAINDVTQRLSHSTLLQDENITHKVICYSLIRFFQYSFSNCSFMQLIIINSTWTVQMYMREACVSNVPMSAEHSKTSQPSPGLSRMQHRESVMPRCAQNHGACSVALGSSIGYHICNRYMGQSIVTD